MKKSTKPASKKFIAWVAQMADISTPKTRTRQRPVEYGILPDTRVDAPRKFNTQSAALKWVFDQLRPFTSIGRNGKAIKGIVYGPEGRRRSIIKGRAQVYVINDRAKSNQVAQAYAAGFVRVARSAA